MPNPPFQPLTLSVEEWQRYKDCECTCDTGACAYRDIEPLVTECEAQSQEAASLRQRLEEANAAGENLHAKWREAEAQLAQAQQERDKIRVFLGDASPASERMWKANEAELKSLRERASLAEAALEEMQKRVENLTRLSVDADGYVLVEADGTLLDRDEVLAELQRRRSRPAEER